MAAENKLDARQESAAYQGELDSGLGRCRGGRIGRKRFMRDRSPQVRLGTAIHRRVQPSPARTGFSRTYSHFWL